MSGLEAALGGIVGLRFYGYPVERIEPPAAVTSPPKPKAITAGDGAFAYEFPLWVMVGKADAKAATDEIMAYVDPDGARSIRAALYADISLGGIVDSVAILDVEPQVVSFAGTEFFAAEFTLEVIA